MQVVIRAATADEPGVVELIRELDRYQLSLYPAESNHLDSIEELDRSNVYFVCASVAGEIVGCGAVKKFPGDDGYGEIKRVYVSPSHRGQGVSSALLESLEQHLREHAVRFARLETGVHQPEALALYRNKGYVERTPFGAYHEDPLSVFMEKDLLQS